MVIPFYINSGYRCIKHNASVGGSVRSKHLLGIAADICTKDWGGADRRYFLELALPLFGGVGIANDYFHVDAREYDETVWIY